MSTHICTMNNKPYKLDVPDIQLKELEIMTIFGGRANGKCLNLDIGVPGTDRRQNIVLTKLQCRLLRDIITINMLDD